MSCKKFIIENHSSYHLHPLEGLRVLIIVVSFYSKNHELWESEVRITLKAKNKLRFIEGSIEKPTPKEGEDTSELQAWEMMNSMICS